MRVIFDRRFGVGVLACLSAVLVVSAVSVLACGDSETASTTARNAPEAATIAPDSAPGSATRRAELPDGFPSDIPSYPGAVLTGANSDGSEMVASFETPDAPATVAERLKRDFIADGWSAEVSIQDEGGSVSAGKQGRSVIVMLSVSSGKTLVDFFVTGGG